ncbi:MAG: hypothetical protein ACREMC_03160, partial [Gemmatimonadales bacterium]
RSSSRWSLESRRIVTALMYDSVIQHQAGGKGGAVAAQARTTAVIGKPAMVDKAEITKRRGCSPDWGDALVMSLAGDEDEALLRFTHALAASGRAFW